MKPTRAYGEGSVYQESANKWTAKINLGKTPDGKPLTKRFSAKTKAAVEKKLRDFKKAQRQEAKPSTIHYTLAAYFDYWLKTYQYQKLKPLSFAGSLNPNNRIYYISSMIIAQEIISLCFGVFIELSHFIC